MKKIAAKLVLIIFSSLLLVTITMEAKAQVIENGDEVIDTGSPYGPPPPEERIDPRSDEQIEEADVASKVAAFLNNAKQNPCIKNKNEGDPDKNYIITFIEEPLTFEEEGETPKDNYVSRICYRNTINYTVGRKVKTAAELSTICQGEAEDFSPNEIEKYKINISCQAIQVILSKGGTSLIEGYISTIYTWAASIVGIIAVLVIIISGIQISAAGGDTQVIDSAKKRIGKSLLGLVILLLSGLILYTINPTFFVK